MLMDYPLCDRTVTLYRRQRGGVERRVLHGCWYQWQDVLEQDRQGERFDRKFLLIQPGQTPLAVGDRVFDGIGPEVVDWESFLPVSVPGLSQVAYAAPRYWQGEICHWEAGRK